LPKTSSASDPLLANYKLTIAYDGTRYSGWQVQPNGVSIQSIIESALSTILKENSRIVGSGRTDAGVHALGQVAHFFCGAPFDQKKLLLSLNGLLPIDIRAIDVQPVAGNFHARYSAKAKTYRYHLQFKEKQNPFKRLYSYHLPYPIDLQQLRRGAKLMLGTHDFTSFANQAHRGSASHDAVRTLKRLDLFEEEDGIYLELEGDGFLYKMVRNIVGTLLDCARGKIEPDQIPLIFEKKDRKAAAACAPAHGLFLVKVSYES